MDSLINSDSLIDGNTEYIRERLEWHYLEYGRNKIGPDPIEFLYRFSYREDIELAGLLSSLFAYGGVRQINASLKKLFDILGEAPVFWLKNIEDEKLFLSLRGIQHRFYTTTDICYFLIFIRDEMLKRKGIGEYFSELSIGKTEKVKLLLANLHDRFQEFLNKREITATPGLKFFLADPRKGSCCKRLNLYLRWMVRKDHIDFGLWKFLSPSELIIPVDVHIARISKRLGFTKRKVPDWKMAEEITKALRIFNSADPVRYDFALCHIGIRGEEF